MKTVPGTYMYSLVELKEKLKKERKALRFAIKILKNEFASYARIKRNALKKIKEIRKYND